MVESTAEQQWRTDHALLGMFIAARLGPRPRRIAAQEAGIAAASDALDADASDLGARGRRFLAIEYTAHTARRRPDAATWEAAIATVDGLPDSEVRRMARGGMVLRAAQGGWADR